MRVVKWVGARRQEHKSLGEGLGETRRQAHRIAKRVVYMGASRCGRGRKYREDERSGFEQQSTRETPAIGRASGFVCWPRRRVHRWQMIASIALAALTAFAALTAVVQAFFSPQPIEQNMRRVACDRVREGGR